MRTSLWLGLVHFVILTCSSERATADGKVFGRPEVQARVEIPNQQALIYHRDGIECLVIETAFLGEGTNFAWVVPLPGAPKVQPVSQNFFPALRAAFQPRLVHYVHHYYLGVLFLGAIFFLGWRSLKDEVSWVADLPLCLILAVGTGVAGKSVLLGVLTLGFVVAVRLAAGTRISFTVLMLAALLLTFWVGVGFVLLKSDLIVTMGGTAGSHTEVTVLSIQHAGVFDATTIRSEKPGAIMEWLEQNGFAAPKSIKPVVRDYVKRGWVFVANKVRRAEAARGVSVLHPLSFTFSAPTPVYPLRLTGVDNGDCTVDLFVFGDRRASAQHFRAVRCDRVANNLPDEPAKRWKSWLQFGDTDVLNRISNATVGTKLTARLTPKQMNRDAEITWRRYLTRGATVFSHQGAATIALNLALPLAAFGWMFVGACRGGLDVNEDFARRWRWRSLVAALIVGVAVYWWLPKVEIVASQFAAG